MSVLPIKEGSGAILWDKDQCLKAAGDLHESYIGANPFPHVVLDDFMTTSILRRVVDEFPERAVGRFNDEQSQLKTGYQLDRISNPFIINVLQAFNSSDFLGFLEGLTGINALIPDPHFTGGGLHETARGGFLRIHSDFNYYPRLSLIRRINVIVFLNENWEESFGGHLELWSKDMSTRVCSISPVMGRAVIFNTDSDSYHGHPDPLQCPEGRFRRSIALYYYTSPAGSAQVRKHTTIFRSRPGSNDQPTRGRRLSDVLEDFCPPVLWRGLFKKNEKQTY